MSVTVQPVDRATGENKGPPYELVIITPIALAQRFVDEHGYDLEIISVNRN